MMSQLRELASQLHEMGDMVEGFAEFQEKKDILIEALNTISVEDEKEEVKEILEELPPKPPTINPPKRGRKKTAKVAVSDYVDNNDHPIDWVLAGDRIIEQYPHLDSDELEEAMLEMQNAIEERNLEEGTKMIHTYNTEE